LNGARSVFQTNTGKSLLLQKLRAARAAANKPAAHAPTPAPPAAGPATVESLGQQLREVLPTRRLQSVSLCDHEANCLWLSEGALGPDEHMLVLEALEALAADASLPCHETALEDGRLAVFLPVRAPMGNLVGIAMILADSKSVGDDTLERMTAAPVRTIMQRLAVLLKPSGALAGALPPIEVLEDSEPEPEKVADAAEVAEAPEEALEEAPEPPEAAAAAPAVELSLVTEVDLEVEVGVPAPAPTTPAPPAPPVKAAPPAKPVTQPEADDPLSETIISAEEIAQILELELVPDEPTSAAAESAAAPPQAKAPGKAAAPAPAAEEHGIADSGMLRLEFLAEPPVVRPAQNPSAVAKKLHAASKAAEVAPTRGPRPLPKPAPKAPVARAPLAPAPVVNGKAPAPAAAPVVKAVPAAAPATANGAAPGAPPGSPRNPFEPVPAHSRLSLKDPNDDVVVLFDADPVEVPARPGAPAKAAPAAAPAQQARAAAPPAKPAAPPTRVAPARIVTPARTSPAVRMPAPARPAPAAPRAAPAARAPAPTPAPAQAPTPAAAPVTAAPVPVAVPVVAPAPAAVAPVVAAAPPAPVPAARPESPPLDLLPFAKLRAGGQTRRFQVLPRASGSSDEQTLQQLLAWLAGNRSLWNSVPTSFTVNLSVTSLEDERFLSKVGAALNTHGIAGESLGFEIAESLCVQQRATVERFFAQCEKLGVWIAVDDFSFDSQMLPLLRSKALRMLKLDARLTAAALRDKLSQAMVVATVQAAKVLGIHCSAKKADSHVSLQYLTAIGLDYAQGAALAKTVALDAIATVPDSRPGGLQTLENNE
jgi:EAL domain-containing protein (putative c-di-GMP-specific phosphodiesterase class I)